MEASTAEPVDRSWYQTPKGRLVILTGGLLAVAWAAKLTLPGEFTPWVFIAACLIGVAPVARRAFAALRAGMPFTIEMLMTIAAAGALVIGAAEEAALVVFLFAVGEVLEGVAANRARASIRALGDLVPKTALVVEAGGTTREDRRRRARDRPDRARPAGRPGSRPTATSSRASPASTRAR